MKLLTVEGLSKHYEHFDLKDVSFCLEEGTIMGFIGRNGAGKTTTLKSLLNFVHPDAGDIRFFGKSFAENEYEIKQRIGFVSGGISYYPKKKLKTITSVTKSFYKSWDDAAYRGFIERFELYEDKTPEQLSAGMRVKYALALALSHHASLLLLDEPTSGLDPVSRDDLLDVFLDLVADGRVSILFSTHITSDLDKCAEYITYIKNGHIIASEKTDDFLTRYRLLRFPGEVPPELAGSVVGIKRERSGCTALVPAALPAVPGAETDGALDLESVMIHLEKELNVK